MRLLNIGCGTVHHSSWVNLDLDPQGPGVVPHDIRVGLPYPDGSFDACYSSHVLEHLRRDEADALLGEQLRVLRPGGVVRVVVPDLEAMVRNYLELLEQLVAGDHTREADYDWSLIEMFDQVVRERPGGEMGERLRAGVPNPEFVISRNGREAELCLSGADGPAQHHSPLSRLTSSHGRSRLWRGLRARAAGALVRVVAGPQALGAFQTGLFRHCAGEVHRVMYDRFSLARLLTSRGFAEAKPVGPRESRIPAFASFELDTHGDRTRKPDSLFMEAIRPG